MSALDDRIDAEVGRVARSVDGPGSLGRVATLKRRRRAIRWTQRAALATAIVVGSAAGAFALARAFNVGMTTPADDPLVGPTLTPSPGPFGGPCPDPTDRTFPGERIGPSRMADIIGDGQAARVSIYGDENRPARCRYFLVVEHEQGDTGRVVMAPITVFEWLPVPPSIFTIAEIDGEPGLEVVVEFGGPGHPHRTGEVFTYVPEMNFRSGGVANMVLDPSLQEPYSGFPLHGEFPAAVDCTGEPGTIVETIGRFAPGGDDSLYGITRTLYSAKGTAFLPVDEERLNVEVGTEDERWPELADDSFRSCPPG
jgi:hypothetical protein